MLIMNKSLLSACCVLSIVVSSLVLTGGPIAAKSLIKFKSRGNVSTTTGAATRTGPKAPGSAAKSGIIALLPEKALGGLTTSKEPVLWLSLNNVQADKMVVEVLENGKKFASSTATMPTSNGLVRINLTARAERELKVGETYSWKVTFPCESGLDCQQGVESPEITGWIKRSTLNTRQEKAIEQATTPREKAAIYAEAGIWYDSLATLIMLQRKSPQDAEIQADWASLLESAGLAGQAKTPFAEVPRCACKPH
jgi:Domain of Unknown Function (DUF928)